MGKSSCSTRSTSKTPFPRIIYGPVYKVAHISPPNVRLRFEFDAARGQAQQLSNAPSRGSIMARRSAGPGPKCAPEAVRLVIAEGLGDIVNGEIGV